MVERVFVHMGLPKTGTTYLQSIFWPLQQQLRDQGVVLPGNGHQDHLWASRTVREDPRQQKRPERHRTAWRRLVADLEQSSGTGLISHEHFAAASAEQAQRMVAELPADEVHLVVTAREPLGLFAASWQELVKNGATTPMADYGRTVSDDTTDIWNWRTLDLRLVLERWSQAVPPERIHVLALDPGAERVDAWHRFAAIVGIDTTDLPVASTSPNTSLGVAEVETLRRINGHLAGPWTAFDRGNLIRGFLAEERLVPRKGERFWPEPDQVEDCRRRGEDTVAHLRGAPYDVVGDLEHLRVPAELPERRSTGSVTDAEVAAVATELAAVMLADVRELRQRERDQRADGSVARLTADRSAGVPARPGRVRRAARRTVRRVRRRLRSS